MKETKIYDIENLIKLSGIYLNEDEKNHIDNEINDFLKYSETIKNFTQNNYIQMDDIKKTTHFREDNVKSYDDFKALMENAPLLESTFYLVPPQKSIEGEEKKVDSENLPVKDIKNKEFEPMIGLEIHAQLKTKSKLFCSCSTEFGDIPNSHSCPVCSGQPGSLPVLNIEAVNMAIKAGLALNCNINKRSIFARKNYFYPDLPKNYQISQYEEPICTNGFLEIEVNNQVKKIRIHRIHIEEDAGKMVHVGAPGIWGAKASAVDFNRAGCPLIEIVTEPDINSPQEAKEFLIMLRALLIQLDVCEGSMEKGNLRCDANISIREKGASKLGTKVEIKNMNSFKAVERALQFEINRQTELLKNGINIEQETRLWHESSQKTIIMRRKGESDDYRYFPEPDLLPLTLDENIIENLKKDIPLPPLTQIKNYHEKYSLSENESRVLFTHPELSKYFNKLAEKYSNIKLASNWFFNEILSYLSSDNEIIPFSVDEFIEFLKLIESEKITGKIGKEIIKKSFLENIPLAKLLHSENYQQISDDNAISKLVDEVINEFPEEVKLYKSGKKNILSFLVGKIMQKSNGRANPKIANKILIEKLEK